MLLVLRVKDFPISSQTFQLPVMLALVFFELFSINEHFDLSYLYEETKNSEAIFMVECFHNAGIFSIVAYKV